jgi:hypothetical protein
MSRRDTNDIISVKLPKSFVAINLSEKVPGAFGLNEEQARQESEQGGIIENPDVLDNPLPSPALPPTSQGAGIESQDKPTFTQA